MLLVGKSSFSPLAETRVLMVVLERASCTARVMPASLPWLSHNAAFRRGEQASGALQVELEEIRRTATAAGEKAEAAARKARALTPLEWALSSS